MIRPLTRRCHRLRLFGVLFCRRKTINVFNLSNVVHYFQRIMKNFNSILKFTKRAPNVWHMLHGAFVVYKPPGEHFKQTLHTIRLHLCQDLNKLEQRQPQQHVWIEGDTTKPMTVAVGPSWADDPLVLGPRYDIDDVRLVSANHLYRDSSGILVVCIGNGMRIAHSMRDAKHLKFYKLKGILGQATDNFFTSGKIVERSTYNHVKRHHIDKICASMQSSHQKQMFELSGVPIQSQAAYELAVQGPIRPASGKIPMVYSIKCVNYEPPNFTMEVVCSNEDEMYLKELVHSLGMQVRSTATCTQVQCVKYGIFSLEHALLKKHWNLEGIAANLAMCRTLFAANKFMKKPQDPILKDYTSVQQLESGDKLRITG